MSTEPVSSSTLYEKFLSAYIPKNSDFAEVFFATVKLKNSTKLKESESKPPSRILRKQRKRAMQNVDKRRRLIDRHWLTELSKQYVTESIKVQNLKKSDTAELRKFSQGFAMQGLEIQVTKSKNSTQVGKSGLILHETKRTIILNENGSRKTLILPKNGLVFVVTLPTQPSVKLQIVGSSLIGTSSKRVK